jgi:hypothetical protein
VTRDQTVLLAVGGLAAVCLVLLVALLRLRASARRMADGLAALRARVEDLERHGSPAPEGAPDRALDRAAGPPGAPVEFVITDLGSPQLEPEAEPVALDGPAFADIVLRETVVKAASLAHGVRRGLAPATRNRLRFEMKQEVRRSRRQRRADLKAAQRDLHARQRAALAEEAS